MKAQNVAVVKANFNALAQVALAYLNRPDFLGSQLSPLRNIVLLLRVEPSSKAKKCIPEDFRSSRT
jgi:hypothetical protein